MTFTAPLITRACSEDMTDLAAVQFILGRSFRIGSVAKKNIFTVSLQRQCIS